MWWRILSRSFRNRKARLILAIISVVLGSSLVASLTNLSIDIPQKASAQLRSYGANIIVLSQPPAGSTESYISDEDLAYLSQEEIADSIASYVPYLYTLVEVGGQRVVLAGTALDRARAANSWWQITGRWPDGEKKVSEALVGLQVAEKLDLELDNDFIVVVSGNPRIFRVAGILETGAAEESQIFVSLEAAQALAGLPGRISLVQVSALTEKLSLTHLARSIEQAMPGTESRVVGQIARAEQQVLRRVQLLLALVAAFILLASGLVVLSTMTTTLLERIPEIGLMKALGATNRRIIGLFSAEIGVIAASGGIIGYLAGYALAQIISRSVFAASVSPHPLVLLTTIAIAALVSFLASIVPLRRAMKVEPAITLRGE
ncbi:MAG: ABC transporter permease [Chloroflexi bacterium]|nr:ABC transporter permease [Chloroflexota bacterium]